MMPGLPPLWVVETQTLSAASDTIRLPASGDIGDALGWPTGFTPLHLVVLLWARSDEAADTQRGVSVQYNGDTGSNYQYQRFDADSVPADTAAALTGQSGIANMLVVGDSSDSGFNPSSMLVPRAFVTTGFKTSSDLGSANEDRQRVGAGRWDSTAAITDLLLTCAGSGEFKAGTIATLAVVDENFLEASHVISSTTTTLTATGISAGENLSVIGYVRTDRASNENDGLDLGFNADTTDANYSRVYARGYNGGSVSMAQTTGDRQVSGCSAADADASSFGVLNALVVQHSLTDDDAHVVYNGATFDDIAAGVSSAWFGAMQWENTAAITSVQLNSGTGNDFVSGSGLWVYANPRTELDRVELTGDSSRISFDLSSLTTAIPDNATDLMVTLMLRTDRVAHSAGVHIEFNGDTTASNYNMVHIAAYNGTLDAQRSLAFPRIARVPGTTPSDADQYSAISVYIPNYADSSNHQTYQFHGGVNVQDCGVYMGGGRWANNAALTDIDFVVDSGDNFIDGCVAILEAIDPNHGWSGTVMGVANPAKVMGVEKENIGKVMGVEAA